MFDFLVQREEKWQSLVIDNCMNTVEPCVFVVVFFKSSAGHANLMLVIFAQDINKKKSQVKFLRQV